MDRTPWERGRMPTADFTRIRLGLALSSMSSFMQQQIVTNSQLVADGESSDDDKDFYRISDSDEDEGLDGQFEVDLLHSTFTASPVVLPLCGLIGDHIKSLGTGSISMGGERVYSIDEIDPGTFFELTHFQPAEFLKTVAIHHKLPHVFRSTVSRHKCSREIGLFIMLLRFRGNDWKDVEKVVNIRRNTCSDLYATAIVEYNKTDYALLATNTDINRIRPHITEFQEGSQSAGSTHPGMVCAADGKPMPTCRPSYRAAKKRGYSYQNDVQRCVYNSHYASHGLKIAHNVWADGIVQVVVGSIKESDQRMMDRSELDAVLTFMGDERAREGLPRPICYGDPAYTQTQHIHRKHKNALTDAEKHDNACMIRPRSAAEDTFKDFTVLFPYFNIKTKHKIFTHGRAKYELEIVAATMMYNVHTCFYGNQASGLYMVSSPTLEAYFENVNQTPCAIACLATDGVNDNIF